MTKDHREIYRGRELVINRVGDKRWLYMDHVTKEAWHFHTRMEAITFAKNRIIDDLALTVAFIWSKKYNRYLGISITANGDGEFCNEVSAYLQNYGPPHAFVSAERARMILSEDTPWYNSGTERPHRVDYNLENCIVVEVSLPRDS